MLIQLQAGPTVKITGATVFRSCRVAIAVSAERGDEAIARASVGVFTNARIAHAVTTVTPGQTIRRTDRAGLTDQCVTKPVATEAIVRAVHGAGRRIFARQGVTNVVAALRIAATVQRTCCRVLARQRVTNAVAAGGRGAVRLDFVLAHAIDIAVIVRAIVEVIAVKVIEAVRRLSAVEIDLVRAPAKVAEVVGTRIEIVTVEITGAAGELLTIGIRNGTRLHAKTILAAAVAVNVGLRTFAAITEPVAFTAIQVLSTEICVRTAIRVWYVAREIAIPVARLAERVRTVQILRDAPKITEAVTA